MAGRDPAEPHRVATPLELLSDLCFVVAVAQASASLHHSLSEGHAGTGVLGYAMVFFAIWWAWMNFTWFASAYDTDDASYRLLTFVQMAGVLLLAAGTPRAFQDRDFELVTLGYVIMRVALVLLWLRAAHGHAEGRRSALRYAFGVAVVQVGWIARLALPEQLGLTAFLVLVLAELAVPVWAERFWSTSWHPHHIAERYGLFTIIVLGESILAATIAIQTGLDRRLDVVPLLLVACSGMVIVFAMWWLYFSRTAHLFLTSSKAAFSWGYGHYLIFSSAAAIGAGLAVSVDFDTHEAHIGPFGAGAVVAVPVAVFLASLWLVHVRPHRPGTLVDGTYLAGVATVLATPFTGLPLPLIAAVMIVLVVVTQRGAASVRPA
ncbi:low temperature requirement protein A [Nonomuraea angiospora]|uniref:Low temperature requirement protein LtrA n=1 Tax=Nonomuraea angiospora TaxID=46172 RepID=A0ABR9M5Z7_9ACTN|nr:low temperature requirement protein A [Nonomuraea angiospora]MBE1588331.1 low temperature requirement protein LtrA [Nonomuraea angiospora]